MPYRPLGRTGLDVSTVAFGTGSLGEMYGPLDKADAVRLVHQVIDAGINLIDTSPYYGSAQERLGSALGRRRGAVVLATKAGRYGFADFDFSPTRIRSSLENSLRALRTDHVDILQLHDIEFVPLQPLFEDSFAELEALKAEGKCRFIGATGYPVATVRRVILETNADVVLTHNKGSLLDDALHDLLAPIAAERGVGLMNAAAVALGLLTPHGSRIQIDPPWPAAVERSAARMVAFAAGCGVDIAFLANQYAIQRSGAATTVIGAGRWSHVQAALTAAATPIDDEVLDAILALRPDASDRAWTLGLPENN
jgi:aryl-alcohol dehydrogenase-like predicted oxidoreductase